MKKVKFYVALVAFLAAAPAMSTPVVSAESLELPIAKVQQELAEKAEQAVSDKLRECREREAREEEREVRYPVRIAGPSLTGSPLAAF
ncbi:MULTISPECIES: hypothetical protein [Microbulbifer]|uniref:hypothetical protein n=1 Tax=Microbulbifer TaxID=48073 RepID=UPI001E35F62E|nr:MULTISPECIES: hypothetical protein [Microbulbifer]UHQ55463.1 hypothetical protein LVE68_00300 [Microbulbifer sp. YPW16]